MSKRFIVVLFGALVGALLIAGCGSSSDSSSITKAEFVKQANSICETSEKQGEAEVEEFLEEEGLSKNEEPSEEVKEQLAEEVILPNIAAQLEEVRDLGFPEGTEGEEAEAIVESAEANVAEGEAEPSALFTGHAFKQTNKEAREYGLTVCGSES